MAIVNSYNNTTSIMHGGVSYSSVYNNQVQYFPDGWTPPTPHVTEVLFSGPNGTIIHDITAEEIIVNYTGSNPQLPSQIIIKDRNVGATDYWRGYGYPASVVGDYYCWGGDVPFVTPPTNEDTEDWSQTQTPAEAGYHIPEYTEWSELLTVLDELIHWSQEEYNKAAPIKRVLLISSTGIRYSDGTIYSIDTGWSYFWSANESSATKGYFTLLYGGTVSATSTGDKNRGITIRLFKD